MRHLLIVVLLIMPFLLMAQSPPPDCKDLHTGVFYYYSQIDNNHSIFLREEAVQKEINLETGDTALWKITWADDCRYQLAYVSGNPAADALSGGGQHTIVVDVQIIATTQAYYLYRSILTAGKRTTKTADTLWRSDQSERHTRKNVVEASFPGGPKAWQSYLAGVFSEHQSQLSKIRKEGVCFVRFLVDTTGKVSKVEALSMQGTPLAKVAVDAVKDGPDWLPASVDGALKKAMKIQPIKFQVIKDEQ